VNSTVALQPGLDECGSTCIPVTAASELLFRPFTTTGSPSAARQHDFELTTAVLLERAATQTRGLEPPREVSDPSLEQAESARVLTGEAVQAWEEKPQAETPIRNLFNRDHAKEVQQRLVQLGYLSVSATGVWGPLSRKALRDFKSDHDLAANENWDQATERSLFSVEPAEPFVGIWGATRVPARPGLIGRAFCPL